MKCESFPSNIRHGLAGRKAHEAKLYQGGNASDRIQP